MAHFTSSPNHSSNSTGCINRMVDMENGIDKGEIRNPVKSKFPLTMAQKTIEETLIPLEMKGIMTNLSSAIKIAKKKAKQLVALYSQLNEDQKAAIVIYTMDIEPVSVRAGFMMPMLLIEGTTDLKNSKSSH